MIVKEHKEYWTAGKSEVHIMVVLTDYAYDNDAVLHATNSNPHRGTLIRQFSRKEVKHMWSRNVNFLTVDDWNIGNTNDTPYANILLFEYDWAVSAPFVREATWYDVGVSPHKHPKKTYRSAHDAYYIGTVTLAEFSGYSLPYSDDIWWNAKN